MHRLDIGIPIPEVYVCEDKAEAGKAKSLGLPYLVRPNGMSDELLVGHVMYRTLKSKFPHIKWEGIFGIEFRSTLVIEVPGGEADAYIESTGDSDVADIATEERTFSGGFDEGELDYCPRMLDEYIGDLSAEVSIEELQALNLLPTFLSDIADSIRRNLYGYDWTEGYNKKLGVPIGNFNAERVRKNLMILDISGSVPRGVSATMLTLIDTLRTQANADLIITGSTSLFYAAGDELPTPQWIRNNCGYGNEARQFYKILERHVKGNEYGNVICFGDEDTPEHFKHYGCSEDCPDMSATRIGKLWSYHTSYNSTPGYARWIADAGIECEEEVNTRWCKLMHRR